MNPVTNRSLHPIPCTLAICLLTLSAAAVELTSAPFLTVTHRDSVVTPLEKRTISDVALLRDGPFQHAAVVARLPFGTRVIVDSIASGDTVGRECDEAPFAGCVARTDQWAWCRATTPRGERRGYCALINLAVRTGEERTYAVEQALGYDELQQYGLLYGRPSRDWALPSPTGGAFLDSVAHGFFMVKQLTCEPAPRIICSPAELELLCRLSLGRGDILFRYADSLAECGRSDIRPPAKSIQFAPPLPCAFILRSGEIVQSALMQLGDARVFQEAVGRNGMRGKRRPIAYASKTIPSNALACMLMTPDVAEKLASRSSGLHCSVDVKVTKGDMTFAGDECPDSSPGMDTTVTISVHLNADSRADVMVFYSSDYHAIECKDLKRGCSAVHRSRRWYCHGLHQYGQVGPEGY